jgi:phosphatidylinositol alpha-1,6-mannosyltransferase
MPLIRRHDLCLVNSRYSRSLALAAGVGEGALRVLNPGVEIPLSADPGQALELRRRLGLEHRLLLLSVGRLTERKGLLEFIRHALPLLLAGGRELGLLVIGDDAADALGQKTSSYGARLRQAVREQGLEPVVRFLTGCPDQTLAAAYQAADVLVFPVLDRPGDAEGFGMVAIEAAAHGTPTVAFAVGGIPDAVRDGVSGILVPAADYPGMAKAVLRAAAEYASPEARVRCREFAAGFRWQAFGERLRKLIAPPGMACESTGAGGLS